MNLKFCRHFDGRLIQWLRTYERTLLGRVIQIMISFNLTVSCERVIV